MTAAATSMKGSTIAALLAAGLLALTIDERSFGVVTDGQQMLSASYALAHGLGLGVSRNNPTAIPRAQGDSVPRYGLGLSLAEAVPMLATRALRTAAPTLPSRPLFVALPISCLVLAAWAAARAAEALGASRSFAILAGLALPLATPLWGYAGSDFSEPLQAACLALLVAAAAVIRGEKAPARAWPLAAGAAAGLALLTKSFLLVPALPLLFAAVRPAPGAPKAALPRWPALAAFACAALVWGGLDLLRFGHLLGGYPGEGFSFPLAEGLARLSIFPNKGLLFYAPVVLLAPAGVLALRGRDRLLALALLASSGGLLLAVASWWAWDGQVGWGPRLLVPAIPALVVLAAAAGIDRPRARAAFAACAVLGVCVNLPGALVPFAGAEALAAIAEPPLFAGAPGGIAEAPAQHLARNPSWSPIRLHARLLLERVRGGDVEGRLATGAFADFSPPLVPKGSVPGLVASPLTVGFWGRTWIAPLPGGVDPYDWAADDQRRRARELRRPERR